LLKHQETKIQLFIIIAATFAQSVKQELTLLIQVVKKGQKSDVDFVTECR